MRGTVAKRIRRKVYGTGYHPGPVQYRWTKGGIVSDPGRQTCQNVKREYVSKRRQYPVLWTAK